MKSLTLNIVIPVFNEQDHIKNCLSAIAAQTVMPDQVIVVDNNSSDKTAEIARQFPFVKLLRENRQGVLFARNTGFDAARGQLIARIDGDTILPEDWVEKVTATYRQAGCPALFAATAPSAFRNRAKLIWYAMHRLTYFWPNRLVLGHPTLVGSNMFITKQLWRRVRRDICARTDMHEDMDLAFHCARTGTEIRFIKELRASIMGRKMLSRSITYPLMMYRVWTCDQHSAAAAQQP